MIHRMINTGTITTAELREWFSDNELSVNNKGANRNWPDGLGCLEKDNLKLKVIGPKWQIYSTFGTSFGYLEGDEYKSIEGVIHEMV